MVNFDACFLKSIHSLKKIIVKNGSQSRFYGTVSMRPMATENIQIRVTEIIFRETPDYHSPNYFSILLLNSSKIALLKCSYVCFQLIFK